MAATNATITSITNAMHCMTNENVAFSEQTRNIDVTAVRKTADTAESDVTTIKHQ